MFAHIWILELSNNHHLLSHLLKFLFDLLMDGIVYKYAKKLLEFLNINRIVSDFHRFWSFEWRTKFLFGARIYFLTAVEAISQ